MTATSKNCAICYTIVSLLGFLSLATQATPTYLAHSCSNTSTYTPNSKFHGNLNALLYSLTTNSSQEDGYYMTLMGFGTTDAVIGLFLCRGDLNTSTCQECVPAAAREITHRCPNQTESVIWYDECMLRYTNRYFKLGSTVPRVNMENGKNISGSQLNGFNQSLFSLLNDLASKAANSQSVKKFAIGQVKLNSNQTVYGLEQCTGDITADQCEMCLKKAIGTLPTCCEGKEGARALLASCNIRYELYQFYNISGSSAASSLTPSSG